NWSGILDNYFKSSINNTIAWTSAVAIPKKVLLETNGFDESITLGAGEDTDLWIRIALNYPVAFSNIATAVHNLHAFNRLSNSNTNKRTFLNLDKYEEEANKRPYLKKYLDRNRFSIGLQYKLSGNSNQSKDFFKKIAKKNLNWKQKILLSSPMFLLKAYISIQRFLRKIGVKLTPFH
ncbi:MAG TPA: hypothetical protein VKZ97_01660, partial [Flavobacteriaceae bacterium]|nr:hypothetical protein [Flavobacteriaceae bacterium]